MFIFEDVVEAFLYENSTPDYKTNTLSVIVAITEEGEHEVVMQVSANLVSTMYVITPMLTQEDLNKGEEYEECVQSEETFFDLVSLKMYVRDLVIKFQDAANEYKEKQALEHMEQQHSDFQEMIKKMEEAQDPLKNALKEIDNTTGGDDEEFLA